MKCQTPGSFGKDEHAQDTKAEARQMLEDIDKFLEALDKLEQES